MPRTSMSAYMRSLSLGAALCLPLAAGVAVAQEARPPAGEPARGESCGPQSARILILGTYHMDNPRLDAKNLDADDVLLPRRQREIAELVERLARFNPTKIAVEAPYSERGYWEGRYKKFLAAEHKLGRNEIEQIGFQLARRLGLPTIHPVDYPMFMSGLRYDEVEQPRPKSSASPTPAPANPAAPPALSEGDLLLRRSTVTEFLLYLNDAEKARREHGENYLRGLLPDDNPAIYERADRVSNWYRRELRIFSNLNRITEFPGDRVLLIIGAGHLKIQRELALDAPQFCLVEADAYLK